MTPGSGGDVPGDAGGRIDRLRTAPVATVRRAVADTHRNNEPIELAAVAVWAVACTVTHFTSMTFGLYAQVHWWDTAVHAASGFGVAAVVFVLRPRLFRHPIALWVAIPAVVAAVGTWFEVYERLFTDFWVPWPTWFYLQDTAVDIVADTAGAVVFGAVRYAAVVAVPTTDEDDRSGPVDRFDRR
jgi:hypothetical protein